jgi:hypothetical protein
VCGEAPTSGASAHLANLAVADVLEAGNPPVGAEAGWRLEAPPGTMISEARGSDRIYKETNNDWEATMQAQAGETLDGQTCVVELRSGLFCETMGFQVVGLTTSSLRVVARCVENPSRDCPDGATLHEVRAELDEAIVTISDPQPPTGVGGAVPSGPQQGTISVATAATDPAAGVESLSVVDAEGHLIGGPVPAPEGCDFSRVTPCPTSVSGVSVPVDTTRLANGDEQIRVAAENAAHDVAYSSAYTLDVQNHEGEGGSGTSAGGGNVGEGTTGGGAAGGPEGTPSSPSGSSPAEARAGAGNTGSPAPAPADGSLVSPAPGPGLTAARTSGCRRRPRAAAATRQGRSRRSSRHGCARRTAHAEGSSHVRRHRVRHARRPRRARRRPTCECGPATSRLHRRLICPMCRPVARTGTA